MNIEKYCVFKDNPDFLPMMNPNEMLQYGVHEGVALNPEFNIKPKPHWLDKGLVQNVQIEKYNAPKPELSINYFKSLETTPNFTHSSIRDSIVWFEWYLNYYYGAKDKERDRQMVDWWKHVVVWGMKDAPKNAHTDQMLLHYAWNPGWEPTVIKL